jgi:queuine/archaeosine tRNA-ribosyltransferase
MGMQRASEIELRGAAVALPTFYPSVSSVKTNLSVSDYVRVLVEVGYPNFLVSAYDYVHAEDDERQLINQDLKRATEAGSVILLDSGNYESFWLRDATWSADSFQGVCRVMHPSLAFSFDDQNPPDHREGAIAAALGRARSDSLALPGQVIVPIVHNRPIFIPDVVADVVRAARPVMVAIPERELGEGIVERCRAIASVRSRLNELEYYCPIHVLGTGNPYSLFAFALSGADSFDGLEWCQTVVDFASGQLSHFQHWELFTEGSPIPKAEDFPYQYRTLAHNLVFWAELMRSIREFIRHGRSTDLTDAILSRIRPILPVNIS